MIGLLIELRVADGAADGENGCRELQIPQDRKRLGIVAEIAVVHRDEHRIGWQGRPLPDVSDEVRKRDGMEALGAQQPHLARERLRRQDGHAPARVGREMVVHEHGNRSGIGRGASRGLPEKRRVRRRVLRAEDAKGLGKINLRVTVDLREHHVDRRVAGVRIVIEIAGVGRERGDLEVPVIRHGGERLIDAVERIIGVARELRGADRREHHCETHAVRLAERADCPHVPGARIHVIRLDGLSR